MGTMTRQGPKRERRPWPADVRRPAVALPVLLQLALFVGAAFAAEVEEVPDSLVSSLQHDKPARREGSGRWLSPIYYAGILDVDNDGSETGSRGGDAFAMTAFAEAGSTESMNDVMYGTRWIVRMRKDVTMRSVKRHCAATALASPGFKCHLPGAKNGGKTPAGEWEAWNLLRMFEIRGSMRSVLVFREAAGIECESIERDLGSTATRTDWHLDRIDQMNDVRFDRKPYPAYADGSDEATGKNVSVYIFDSGVYVDHPVFNGVDIGESNTFVAGERRDGRQEFNDEYNHGTHVASIVVSVAKDVTIHSVKVLDEFGNAGWSNIIRYGVSPSL